MFDSLFSIIISIPGILLAFTVHEYGHARMAYNLGDNTPKFQGRLTLNPISHIDPIGFIMILLFHFGWAKPVQVNKRAFKNYRKDDLKVSFAGPLANFLTSIIVLTIFAVLNKFVHINNKVYIMFILIMQYAISINMVLFFLNLMPIPGFDGFHILKDLFPKIVLKLPQNIEAYGNIMFILCVLPLPFLGNSIFYYMVHYPASVVLGFFEMIFGL